MRNNDSFIDSPFANVFLFSLFWAIQIIISKLGFNAGAKPVAFLIQSSVVSLIILTLFVLPQRYKELKNMPFPILVGLMIANIIHFGLGAFFFNSGIALTSAINAGFLVKFTMVTTIFLAWLILKERLTVSKIVAAVIMMLGVFFITTKGQLVVPQTGDILILLACFSWSIGNVLVRKTIKSNPVSGEMVSFLRPIAGLPVLVFFLLLSPLYPKAVQPVFSVNLLDLSYLPYVLANGFLVSLFSIFLNRTLKIASASYVTMMSMMTPVLVGILAIMFLGDKFAFLQLVGAVLIVSSGFVTHHLKINEH